MPDLIYEKRDGIALLTMNRPEKRNALSPQMMVQLADAWTDFRDDPDARVAILTGAGDKAFSAGADLGLLIPLMSGARQPEDDWDKRVVSEPRIGRTALLRGFELYKPVIAAVNGFALAFGMEILQATDLRVAAPHASFGLSEVKRGIIPAGGSLVRLARQISYAKAMEILLTGERIDAQEAHRIGLLNEIVPANRLLARAEELARLIADTRDSDERAAARRRLSDRERVRTRVMRTEDAVEGPRAFMKRRKAVFKGR